MGNRADCIRKTKRDGNWVIEGHDYEPFLAVYDEDTDRTYLIDRCMRCDKRQAAWCSGKADEIKHYPQYVPLGGEPSEDVPEVLLNDL